MLTASSRCSARPCLAPACEGPHPGCEPADTAALARARPSPFFLQRPLLALPLLLQAATVDEVVAAACCHYAATGGLAPVSVRRILLPQPSAACRATQTSARSPFMPRLPCCFPPAMSPLAACLHMAAARCTHQPPTPARFRCRLAAPTAPRLPPATSDSCRGPRVSSSRERHCHRHGTNWGRPWVAAIRTYGPS